MGCGGAHRNVGCMDLDQGVNPVERCGKVSYRK